MIKRVFLLIAFVCALFVIPQTVNATSTTLTVKYEDGKSVTYPLTNFNGTDDWWIYDSRIPQSATAGGIDWNGKNGYKHIEDCDSIAKIHWVLNDNRLVISSAECEDHEETTTTSSTTTTVPKSTTSSSSSTTSSTSTSSSTTSTAVTTTTIPETTTTGIVTTTSGVTTTDVTTTTTPSPTPPPPLPDTGSNSWMLFVLGMLAITVGGTILYLRRT